MVKYNLMINAHLFEGGLGLRHLLRLPLEIVLGVLVPHLRLLGLRLGCGDGRLGLYELVLQHAKRLLILTFIIKHLKTKFTHP